MRTLLRAAAAAALVAAGALPAAAAPGDGAAEAAFTRGQRLEEALGDLEGALDAFRAAGAATEPGRRASAVLRQASLLRRLGRAEESRAALEARRADGPAWEAPGTREAAERALALLGEAKPSEEPEEIRVLRERRRADEEELLRLKRRLAEALTTTAEVEPLRTALKEKERELRELQERMRDASRAARGSVGELSEREREERRREDAEAARVLSAEWTRYGRDFYAAGRFEDARRFLRDAVDLDPDNAAARDLLARASAPYRDREQIVRGILEILAMEQELRAEQVRVDATALVEEGERLLAEGKAADALARFDGALARIAAPADLRDRLESLRAKTARLFDEAAARSGSPRRAPAAPPATPAEDPRWLDAVRAVLERAGSAGEEGGAALRILPLGPALRAGREALPPSPDAAAPLRGFTLEAEPPPLAPLVEAVVGAAVEPGAWRSPGAVLEGVGATLVARAGPKALEAVERAVGALAEPPTRSLLVRVHLVPCDPALLVAALAKAGTTAAPLPRGTGVAAVLDASAADALLAALGGPEAGVAGGGFRVPERRAFAGSALRPRGGAAAEEEVPGIRLRGLGWFLPDGGIAAAVEVGAAVAGPAGAAEALGASVLSRQEAVAGGVVAPGGALLLAGLASPFEGAPHLAVIVRLGEDAAPPGGPAPVAAAAVLPLGDLPLLHADVPGPLGPPPGTEGRAGRAAAIREWIAGLLPAGARVRAEGTGLRVEGSAAAAEAARAALGTLRSPEPAVALRVRAFALDPRTEASLVRGLPLAAPAPGAALRVALLAGDDRKRQRFLLEGIGGALDLGGDGSVRAAPGQRVAVGRLEGAGAAAAGFEAGVRGWPARAPGEAAFVLDVALRWPGETTPRREPAAALALPAGRALLVVGLPNPFPGSGGKNRLALWIE